MCVTEALFVHFDLVCTDIRRIEGLDRNVKTLNVGGRVEKVEDVPNLRLFTSR